MPCRRFCPVVLLFVLMISLTAACRGRHEPRRLLARIDGIGLYTDEFRHQWARNRLEPDDLGGPPAQTQLVEKRALLSDLIGRRLLLAEAEGLGVVVASDEVDAAMQRLSAGWGEDLAGELRRRDMTQLEIRRELRDVLMIRRYLRDQVFARIAITDAEIENYAATNPDEMQGEEEVHLRQINVATQERAEAVRRELSSGLAFEDAAIKHSLAPSARMGGDLGMVRREALPAAFAEVGFALAEGQVSAVVPSNFGFHLLKCLSRRAAGRRSVAEMRGVLEVRLRREREHEATGAKLRTLWESHRVEIKEDRLALVL